MRLCAMISLSQEETIYRLNNNYSRGAIESDINYQLSSLVVSVGVGRFTLEITHHNAVRGLSSISYRGSLHILAASNELTPVH